MIKRELSFYPYPERAAEASYLIPHYRATEIAAFCAQLNSSISMLHPDVLMLLYHFGRVATAPILEFGPYIGGSTVALCRGIKDAGRTTRVTSVELSGGYSHPQMVTGNIAVDLRKNLALHGVDNLVDVLVGNSRDPVVRAGVIGHCGASRYGFMMIDTDGKVREDWELYRPFLSDNAYLMVDDYFSPGAPEKGQSTSSDLNQLEAEGKVETLGVYGWGTWLGRVL